MSGELYPGDRVVDRDDQDPDVAVVVNLPGEAAAGWDVPERDTTVAENPDYDAHAPVSVVVFEDTLEEYRPGYDRDREIPLAYLDAPHYTFPAPRLEGRADVEPTVDGDEVVLGVEKLGEEYVIRADGSVEGDGAIRDRLESAVEEVVA